MSDNVTNELILEHLKAIQTKLSDISNDIADLKTDMRGVKGHMASFMQSEVAQRISTIIKFLSNGLP